MTTLLDKNVVFLSFFCFGFLFLFLFVFRFSSGIANVLSDIDFSFENGKVFELGRQFFLNHPMGTPQNLGKNITRISRVHCRFSFDVDCRFVLEDVSANYTWINGRRMGKGKKVFLKNGDKIVLLFDQSDAHPLLEYTFEARMQENSSPKQQKKKGRKSSKRKEMEKAEVEVKSPTRGILKGFSNEKGAAKTKKDIKADEEGHGEEKQVEENQQEEEEGTEQPRKKSKWESAAQVGVFAVGWWYLWQLVPSFT